MWGVAAVRAVGTGNSVNISSFRARARPFLSGSLRLPHTQRSPQPSAVLAEKGRADGRSTAARISARTRAKDAHLPLFGTSVIRPFVCRSFVRSSAPPPRLHCVHRASPRGQCAGMQRQCRTGVRLPHTQWEEHRSGVCTSLRAAAPETACYVSSARGRPGRLLECAGLPRQGFPAECACGRSLGTGRDPRARTAPFPLYPVPCDVSHRARATRCSPKIPALFSPARTRAALRARTCPASFTARVSAEPIPFFS